MSRFNVNSLALLCALTVGAVPAAAQKSSAITINRGPFSIAPYAGYLITESFIEGPLDIGLGAVSSPLFGVQASLPLAPAASLVGTIGYASGDLEVGLPILGGIPVGNTTALLLDAAVELRAHGGGRFAPLVQLGGGALRREVTVAGISADATDFQVSLGLGADLPIAANLALRLLAKDHYGRSDFGGLGELRARTRELHNVALTAGLQLSF